MTQQEKLEIQKLLQEIKSAASDSEPRTRHLHPFLRLAGIKTKADTILNLIKN